MADSQFYYSTEAVRPGYSEQDPETIWNAFADSIKEVVNTLKYAPVSISLSSAMHGLLVVDHNNKALTPFITWADTRSEEIAEQMRKLPLAEKIYKETGTPIHSMSPLCKIMWLKENEPGIFKAAFKFISIKEYIWYKLFNQYETDHSIASATGLLNIQTLQWNETSLQLADIDPAQLSHLVATCFIRKDFDPSFATRLNVPANTLFCIGASDGCLANVGSYAVDAGTAALTIGTSGAVRIAATCPVFNFEAMIFNYILDDNTFISGGPVNNGGNVLSWLFDTFLNNSSPSEEDYDVFFESIANIPAGSNGLIFLPYLTGERAPVWDESSSGVFFGIKSYHSQACFLRAGLEGICYSLNQVLKIVESLTQHVQQLNVSGGFIHSTEWVQILADITGKKVCVIESGDASAIGAALLNMKALKMIKDYASMKPSPTTIVEPDMEIHAMHQKNYSIFKNLYGALKQSMHEVHEINGPKQ